MVGREKMPDFEAKAREIAYLTPVAPGTQECSDLINAISLALSEAYEEGKLGAPLRDQATHEPSPKGLGPAGEYPSREAEQEAVSIDERGAMLGEVDAELANQFVDKYNVGLHAMYVTNADGSPRLAEIIWTVAESVLLQKNLEQGWSAGARRAFSKGPPMSEWQPIETVPKDGTEILLTGTMNVDGHDYPDHIAAEIMASRPIMIGSWTKSSGCTVWTDEETSELRRVQVRERWHHEGWDVESNGLEPTHWMPLPKPPSE